jgi:hypothetical protein
MKLRAFSVAAVAAALALASLGEGTASAALTPSERSQVKDFVSRGQLANVGRVRSLVARTDLTADETFAALSDAFAAVPFTAQRALFAKELVFGGASAASRPILAEGIVKALFARADAVYERYVGGLDHEPKATNELVAIYGFLDERIANAGKPTAAAHDASSGIPTATYEACSKQVRAHVDHNARWLKGQGTIGEGAGRVRAQAQALLLDMLPDGLTRRVDAADRLALTGARRTMLVEWGVLLEDAGKLDEAAAGRVRQLLGELPAARTDLEVVYAGHDKGPLRARGIVVETSTGMPGSDAYPFGDEVVRGAGFDPATSTIAYDLAVLATRRALEDHADLRQQAERDALAAHGDRSKLLGAPRGPGVDQAVGAAAHLLVLDAPRAVELAVSRFLKGKPESAALLSDAVAALAANPPAHAGGPGTPRAQLPVLHVGPATAGGKPTRIEDIHLSPKGLATGFTIVPGHVWQLDRSGPADAVTAVRLAGQSVSPAQLKLVKGAAAAAPATKGPAAKTPAGKTPAAAKAPAGKAPAAKAPATKAPATKAPAGTKPAPAPKK